MIATASGRLASLLARNNAYIPGGVSSTNRVIDPAVAFVRGQGAYLWDIDDKRYIDYHAAFAPQLGTTASTRNDVDRDGELDLGMEAWPSVVAHFGDAPGVRSGRG